MPTGYLVVDHGSRRATSNDQLRDMARRVARLRPDHPIEVAHMEVVEPSIDQGFDALVAAGVDHIVVLLYFLADGRHVQEDVPALVAAARQRHPGVATTLGRALGPDDRLAALMLERAGEDLSEPGR